MGDSWLQVIQETQAKQPMTMPQNYSQVYHQPMTIQQIMSIEFVGSPFCPGQRIDETGNFCYNGDTGIIRNMTSQELNNNGCLDKESMLDHVCIDKNGLQSLGGKTTAENFTNTNNIPINDVNINIIIIILIILFFFLSIKNNIIKMMN